MAVNEKFKKVKKVVEQEPVEVKKKKKVGVEAAVEVPKIQKKKLEELNNQGKDAEPKKSKKKKVEAVVEEHEKKKSKKRKLEESMKAVEEEVVKPKLKKLNILSQIEDPHHNSKNLLLRQESSKNVVEQPFAVPLASQKLKKLIPKALEVEKKKRKKTTKKVYAEPQSSLPQPVWTSAGMFMEESVSAYKFTKTRYVPIQSGKSSTKFGVVVFEGSKKKKQQTQQMSGDFKTQAMQRNKKNRDGSSKNLQDLTGHSRNTM